MPNATEEKGCVLERERERACCSQVIMSIEGRALAPCLLPVCALRAGRRRALITLRDAPLGARVSSPLARQE